MKVEAEIQRQIVAWWDAADPSAAFLFHVPNEGKRDALAAAKLRPMGVRAGVADLVIVRQGGSVAFAELKTPIGRQGPEQRRFEETCAQLGTPYRVVYDLETFRSFALELGVQFNEGYRSDILLARSWRHAELVNGRKVAMRFVGNVRRLAPPSPAG